MDAMNVRKKILIIMVPILLIIVILCILIVVRGLHTDKEGMVVRDGTYRLSGGAKEEKGYIVISQNGTRIQFIDMDAILDGFTEEIRRMSIHARKSQMQESGEEFTKEEEERVKESVMDYKAMIGEQGMEFVLEEDSFAIAPIWGLDTAMGNIIFSYLPREDTIIVDGYKYTLE